jgi:hypothetical protein
LPKQHPRRQKYRGKLPHALLLRQSKVPLPPHRPHQGQHNRPRCQPRTPLCQQELKPRPIPHTCSPPQSPRMRRLTNPSGSTSAILPYH